MSNAMTPQSTEGMRVLVQGRPYQLPADPNFRPFVKVPGSDLVHLGLVSTGHALCGVAMSYSMVKPDSRLCIKCQTGLRRMGLLA